MLSWDSGPGAAQSCEISVTHKRRVLLEMHPKTQYCHLGSCVHYFLTSNYKNYDREKELFLWIAHMLTEKELRMVFLVCFRKVVCI